jgi:phage-related protein
MFDQILDLVKDQIGGNPQVSNSIPKERQDEVHHEVATQVNNGLKQQASEQGGVGGLLSQLSGAMTSGSPVTNAIQGGVVGALGSKLGLPQAATGAIAAALPGILQKFANKANDPNDDSITHEGLAKSLGGGLPGGLGGKLGNLF